jgi:phosphoglucomutase
MRHFELGILNASNAARAVVIKTFVTTDLQAEIARRYGLRCVETLTGFKYIGEKLGKYEMAIPEELRRDYRRMSDEQTRALRLAHSSYYVFGGEESYGYSASDFVRDKDGNSAAVLVAEAAAHAKSRGLTLVGLLDEIFAEYGVYAERGESLLMEGAEGAAKIKKLVASYAGEPPREVDGSAVTRTADFARDEIRDVEGDLIPKEAMLMIELADGRRAAVRPSGTEPKIKYYMFAKELPPGGGRFAPEEVAAAKARAAAGLDRLWAWLSEDARRRAG